MGYEILGVSADSAKRQSNFRNKYAFPYPLLVDEEKSVINAFGIWGPKKFMGREYDGIHPEFVVLANSSCACLVLMSFRYMLCIHLP